MWSSLDHNRGAHVAHRADVCPTQHDDLSREPPSAVQTLISPVEVVHECEPDHKSIARSGSNAYSSSRRIRDNRLPRREPRGRCRRLRWAGRSGDGDWFRPCS